MMFYTKLETPFCGIILVGDENGLTNLHLKTNEGKRKFNISDEWILNNDFFEETINQISEYFSGKREVFTVRCNPEGTEFQKKVWNSLKEIPFGVLNTYKEIAVKIKNRNGARAVGMANSKNPIPLIIPCHRVIGEDGSLTGFAHGLNIKEKLIEFEKSVN